MNVQNKKQRQRNNNREVVNIIDMHGGSVAAADGRTLYNHGNLLSASELLRTSLVTRE